MFRVMVKQVFDFDSFHGEYSGEKHETREEAEAELLEAKLHAVDDETIDYCYIEEC